MYFMMVGSNVLEILCLFENTRWRSQLTDVIILVGGVIENGVQACCHCFNPLTNKWHCLSPVIDSRLNFGMTRLHRWLFVVGGSTSGENMNVLSTVERLDPKFNTWEKVASLTSGKSGKPIYRKGLGRKVLAFLRCYMLYENEFGSVVSPTLTQELLYPGEEEERTERRRIKGRKTYTQG